MSNCADTYEEQDVMERERGDEAFEEAYFYYGINDFKDILKEYDVELVLTALGYKNIKLLREGIENLEKKDPF